MHAAYSIYHIYFCEKAIDDVPCMPTKVHTLSISHVRQSLYIL
jgi:hypothetical protein